MERARQNKKVAEQLAALAGRRLEAIRLLEVGMGGDGRRLKTLRFEQDNQTALDGSLVWPALVDQQKAVGSGQFGAKALLHNLGDDDYGRPLDELRDLFWSTPRMPLLFGSEEDLKRAIFEAVHSGELRLVGEDGEDRVVQRAAEMGIGSATLQLPKPVEEEEAGEEIPRGETGPGGTHGVNRETGDPWPRLTKEPQVSVSLRSTMAGPEIRNKLWQLMNHLATLVDDRKISHIEVLIKVVVAEDDCEGLQSQARDAGAIVAATEI